MVKGSHRCISRGEAILGYHLRSLFNVLTKLLSQLTYKKFFKATDLTPATEQSLVL